MKKYLSIAAAIALTVSFTGCASSNELYADHALGGEAAPAASGGEAVTNGEGALTAEGSSSAPGSAGTLNGAYEPTDTVVDAAEAADGGFKRGGVTEADPALAGDVTDHVFTTGDLSGETPSDYFSPDYVKDSDEYHPAPPVQPQSGLLTGGEWNDNEHWEDWKALYESHSEWNFYREVWRSAFTHRLAVKVVSDGNPVEGAVVSCPGCTSAVSDNKGMAYLFFEGTVGSPVTVSYGGNTSSINADWVDWETDNYLTAEVQNAPAASKKLDLMIMCDTTGSMSDELEYLKTELEDIVKKIKEQNSNIPTRVSVNFYRDFEDDYVVRAFPFSENVDEVVTAIRAQDAWGGGDFPEAVDSALNSAVNDHDWDEDAVKIMFLVLDAPPHEDVQIVDSVNRYISQAAEAGIRIVPVASSGIDKSTEYLLRTMAFVTGGTYTFLTNDSGIGGGHIEPTVGAYNVEKLNDMMIRIVNGYLK